MKDEDVEYDDTVEEDTDDYVFDDNTDEED